MIELLGLKFKRVKTAHYLFTCTDDKKFEISFNNYQNSLTIGYGYYKHENSIYIYLTDILLYNFNYKSHKECQKVIDDNIAEICKQLILHRNKYPIKIFNKINYNLDVCSILT